MTRVTNLVKRKRTYISEESSQAPSGAQSSDSSRSKQTGGKSRKSTSSTSRTFKQNTFSKHPRDRVESSEKRRLKRIDDRNADKTCFACRESGHTARDCPNAVSVDQGRSTVGICYRCGSNRHSLSRCKKPENKSNPLPFAQCFVCNQKGHLAGSCPENMNGLYPNGGGCKLCNQNDHLVKDCPTRIADVKANPVMGIATQDAPDAGADEDDFHALRRRTNVVMREEASQQRAEKLKRQSNTQARPAPTPRIPDHVVDDHDIFLDSAPSLGGMHPDRQAVMDGRHQPAQRHDGGARSRPPPTRAPVPAPAPSPAFIPRGHAAPPSRKTKVVTF